MRYGFESDTAEEFPRYLMYDVNNVCNARCPFCPQSAIALSDEFDPRHLKWEHFVPTIEEAARYDVELVRFTGDGEPLLHPKMTEMIAYARKVGIRNINLTTNGSLLRDKRLDNLLRDPPHIIDISLDAFTPETYAKYRVGLDFDTTIRNVQRLLEQRDPKRMKVVVSMIHQPGLDLEVADFRAYWKDRVDIVAIRKLHSNLGSVSVTQEKLPPRFPCVHLWQRLVVDFRGHIRFCPIDWFDKSYVGDVDKMTLHEAWHSVFLLNLRDRHLSSNYGGCGVCEKCSDWANTPWTQTWMNLVRQPSPAEN